MFQDRLRQLSRKFNKAIFTNGASERLGEGDQLIADLRAIVDEMRFSGMGEENVRLAIGGAILAELITR
jgi:hypothetical protein